MKMFSIVRKNKKINPNKFTKPASKFVNENPGHKYSVAFGY